MNICSQFVWINWVIWFDSHGIARFIDDICICKNVISKRAEYTNWNGLSATPRYALGTTFDSIPVHWGVQFIAEWKKCDGKDVTLL